MLETIKEVFQKHKKTISGFFWAAVISLIILGPAFLHIIAGEVAMFVIVLILLVYLELLGGQLGRTQESMKKTLLGRTQESMKTLLEDIKDYLESPASIYGKQSSAKRDLISFVESENPKKADMLEYSSATVYDVLEALVENQTKIRLLLKNPKKAFNKWQEKRICVQLRQIKTELKDGNFEIRCYNQLASLRGRKFDDKLINVGWYTYHIRDEKTGKMRILGHTNPLLTLKKGKDGYYEIKKFFNKVFGNVMKEAVPLKEVCGNCEKNCHLSGEKEWLDEVSKQR